MSPTLEQLQRQYEEALKNAAQARADRDKLKSDYSRGLIGGAEYDAAMADIKKRIKKWSDEAARLKEAIDNLARPPPPPEEPEDRDARIMELLAQLRQLDDQARAGVYTGDEYARRWEAIVAQLERLGYPVDELTRVPKKDIPEEPPPTEPGEPEDLEARAQAAADEAVEACIGRGISPWACINVGKVAYDAVMEGKTEDEALALAKAAEEPTLGGGALDGLANMITKFGSPGALLKDETVGARISGPVTWLLDYLGLTPEAIEGVMRSPLDRDQSAQLATAVATAAQTGLGLIYSVGVLGELASLGQIDTLVDAIDNVLVNLGLDEIIKPLFTAPFYAALTIPTRQYWMSRFKPTVPPIQDLRTMAVREAFDVETREEQFAEMQRWGAYHGLEEYWAERYLRAGYERMDVRTALEMYYWRLWDEDQLKAFLAIADIHPDDWDSIIATIWRNPTRYERRHGYIMGVYDRADLEEFFHRDGLSDVDSETATEAMVSYALNAERNAVARAAGRIYRETLEELAESLDEREDAVEDAMDALEAVKAALRAGEEGVTQADVDRAEEMVEHARSSLGALKRKAQGVRDAAEKEYRDELEGLKVVGERQDLWVRRYAMEAKVKTRPWELIEEAGVLPTPEPE